jgi:DNA polymerase-3 subunit gamma/tau
MKLCNLQRAIQISTHQPMVDEKKKIDVSASVQTEIIARPLVVAEPKVTEVKPTIQPQTTEVGTGKSTLDKLREQVARQKESEQQSNQQQTENIEEKGENKAFTQEEFQAIWDGYIIRLESTGKSRIASFLKESPVRFLEQEKVEVELKSSLESEIMEDERMDLIPYMRKELQNFNFDLQFSINKDRIQHLSKISKPDQLKRMVDKNPILGDFVQGLGLEIDY